MNRFFTILLTVSALATPVFACEGFEQDMAALEQIVKASASAQQPVATAPFAREFNTAEQAELWAQTSTRGGGRIEQKNFLGEDFIFAFRGYTSGVKSSDAAVYIKEAGKWRLVKAYPAIMGKWIVAERQDDTFLFHPEGEAQSLMTLDRSDIAGL